MTAEELKPIEFLACKYDLTYPQLRQDKEFKLKDVLEIMEQYHEAKTKAEEEQKLEEFMDYCEGVEDVWAREFRAWIPDYMEDKNKAECK